MKLKNATSIKLQADPKASKDLIARAAQDLGQVLSGRVLQVKAMLIHGEVLFRVGQVLPDLQAAVDGNTEVEIVYGKAADFTPEARKTAVPTSTLPNLKSWQSTQKSPAEKPKPVGRKPKKSPSSEKAEKKTATPGPAPSRYTDTAWKHSIQLPADLALLTPSNIMQVKKLTEWDAGGLLDNYAFSQNGKVLALESDNIWLTFIDLTTGDEKARHPVGDGWIKALSPDGGLFAMYDYKGDKNSYQIRDAETNEILARISMGVTERWPFFSFGETPGSYCWVQVKNEDEIKVVKGNVFEDTLPQVRFLPHLSKDGFWDDKRVKSAMVNHGHHYAVTGSTSLRLWHTESGEYIDKLKAKPRCLWNEITVAPDDVRFAAYGYAMKKKQKEAWISVLNAEKNEEIFSTGLGQVSVYGLELTDHPDLLLEILGGKDSILCRFRSMKNKNILHTMECQSKRMPRFHPGGRAFIMPHFRSLAIWGVTA